MKLTDFRGCLFCCGRYPGRCFEIIGGWSREYAFCYDPEEDAIARIPCLHTDFGRSDCPGVGDVLDGAEVVSIYDRGDLPELMPGNVALIVRDRGGGECDGQDDRR